VPGGIIGHPVTGGYKYTDLILQVVKIFAAKSKRGEKMMV
jgi:hypothetical protein